MYLCGYTLVTSPLTYWFRTGEDIFTIYQPRVEIVEYTRYRGLGLTVARTDEGLYNIIFTCDLGKVSTYFNLISPSIPPHVTRPHPLSDFSFAQSIHIFLGLGTFHILPRFSKHQ